MSKAVKIPPPGFDDLPVDDQIEYVQSLWERIAAEPSNVPVPGWHREILDQRMKAFEANQNAGDSWEKVREEIEQKLLDRISGR